MADKKIQAIKSDQIPLALQEAFLHLLEEELRESALNFIASYITKSLNLEDLNSEYRRIGFILFKGYKKVMDILNQEVVRFKGLMKGQQVPDRSFKRMLDVLTIFKCVASSEARREFINSGSPALLLPLIESENMVHDLRFEDIRKSSIAVIYILCTFGDSRIISWALMNNVVDSILAAIDYGIDPSRWGGLMIMEEVLQNTLGITRICYPCSESNRLFYRILATLDRQILRVFNHEFNDRLLISCTMQCYLHLCTYPKGQKALRDSHPLGLIRYHFRDIVNRFPGVKDFLDKMHRLLC